MIVTQALLPQLFVTFSKSFEDGFPMADEQWKKLAMFVTSAGASNTYGWLGQFPRFREWIGSRTLKDLKAHAYSISNKNYESTVKVLRTEIEDDTIGVYSPLFMEMGRAAKDFPNELVFSLLPLGFSQTCYDGQNMFSAAHPVYPNVDGTGTAVATSNFATGAATAWYLLDTSKAVKPFILQQRKAAEFAALTKSTDEHVFKNNEYVYGVDGRWNAGFGLWQCAYGAKVALDATSFNAAFTAMRNFKADGGRPLGIKPNLLVVPPSLRQQAETILKKANNTGGESNLDYQRVELLEADWLA